MAEHSFLVQLIAIDIGRKMGYITEGGPFNVEKEYHIMRWAMWHDLMEVKTGDINTPIKAKIGELAGSGWLQGVEFNMSDEYACISKDTGDTIKDIVKLADFIEAIVFLEEEGKGKHAKDVLKTLKSQMAEHYDAMKRKRMSLKWNLIDGMIDELVL